MPPTYTVFWSALRAGELQTGSPFASKIHLTRPEANSTAYKPSAAPTNAMSSLLITGEEYMYGVVREPFVAPLVQTVHFVIPVLASTP